MNRVTLIGRLARDAEQKGTDKTVAKFTVAVDRPKKADGTEQSADFISCVAFAKTADMVLKYFNKGKPIALEGHIQTGSYEKEGKKVYTTDVVVDRVEFVPRDSAQASSADDGFKPMGEDEDIPF